MGTQAQPGDPAASRDSQVAPGREALLFPSPETSQSWVFWDIWGPGQEVVQGGGQKPMENCPRGAPVRPRRSCLALERLAVRMECLGVQGTEDPRRGSLPGEENWSPARLRRGCGSVGQAPSGSTQVESGRLGSAFRDLSSWSLGGDWARAGWTLAPTPAGLSRGPRGLAWRPHCRPSRARVPSSLQTQQPGPRTFLL